MLAPLYGGSFSYTAVTTGQPTFNRVIQNGNAVPNTLSLIGTAVRYASTAFAVDQAGNYTVDSLSTTPALWDNYTILYRSTFNPLNPLLNVIIANDDLVFIGRSGFTVNLAIGSYVLVTTGYTNGDAGTAANTISGAGNITSTPEVGTMAMLGLGLILIGAKKLKRPLTT